MGRRTESSKKRSFLRGFLWLLALFALILLVIPKKGGDFAISKSVEAQKTCMDIASAILSFKKDTGKFPVSVPSTTEVEMKDGTSRSVAALMNHLSGEDDSINAEKTAYFTVEKSKAAGEGQEPEDWNFVDPWGEAFHIRMDTNGDGSTEDPRTPGMRKWIPVLVWSSGPDRDVDTWEDNLISW